VKTPNIFITVAALNIEPDLQKNGRAVGILVNTSKAQNSGFEFDSVLKGGIHGATSQQCIVEVTPIMSAPKNNDTDTVATLNIDFTVDSPQIGHPEIGQVLKMRVIAATDALCAVIQPNSFPDNAQILKARGLSGSGGYPIGGLSAAVLNLMFRF
jgi:hypothetical protein